MSDGFPADVIASLRYRDADAGLTWMITVLGMKEHAIHRDKGVIVHGEVTFGNGMVMFGQEPAADETGRLQLKHGQASIYLIVDDAEVEALHDRCVAAESPIAMPFVRHDYGGSGFTVLDPEDNAWSVGSYRPSAEPMASS